MITLKLNGKDHQLNVELSQKKPSLAKADT
ncbi:hypothetical protein HK44_022000 [Pseudomonas fluorescens HK44]|uniref:Uncharacterized protein n=1 Tax=Pseudomonas fluorescens HK44 TaxID=1042209 RepID=A0A010TH10_PSEFL|nr:hypothetical protein HK44_022000 [Pseudomonas fluorescens HK44]